MIVLIDNYDSFTYNLYQLIGEIDGNIKIIRNDQYTVEEIIEMRPNHLILSPGPGHPKEAGICEELIKAGKGIFPILGICLGHQAICEAFGADIIQAARLIHGKKSHIHIANGNHLFHGLSPVIEGGRYHSLVTRKESLPDDLLVIAEDGRGEIMAVKHRVYEIYGLQFHPESILTNGWTTNEDNRPSTGRIILNNFLSIGGESL